MADHLSRPWLPWLVLLAAWALMIGVINPRGDFMVNDDWAFVKSLEAWRATGHIITTGWGPPGAPGGPSLVVHLLLGDLFCRVGGFSLTTLRLAVLTMGVLGSCGLMLLLRTAGITPWLALLATLTVAGNPLYVALSFTYMTDITFAALAIFALLGLFLGIKKSSPTWIIIGLVLTLGAILTRQIGVVILAAFWLTAWLHPAGAALGRRRLLLLGLGLVILPWVAYELFLAQVGSSPLTQHQVVRNIFTIPREKGLTGYLVFLYVGLCHYGLVYLGFFASPLLVDGYIAALRRRPGQYLGGALLVLAALGGAAIQADLFRPPLNFLGNIIYNFGIGPVLLKDTYILGIQRLGAISRPLYFLLALWGAVAAVNILIRGGGYLRRQRQIGFSPDHPENSFLACLALLALFLYLGIITLTSFHDRYLIPPLIFLVIWLVLDDARRGAGAGWRLIPGFGLAILISLWSTGEMHDFMAMKRSLKQAHDYVLQELRVDPCTVDGGFEFNGYYCYRNDFTPRPGLSWWWVSREDYLITLGLLPGYRVVKKFPFQGYRHPPGAIYLLQPLKTGPSGG